MMLRRFLALSLVALFVTAALLPADDNPQEKKDDKAALYARLAGGPSGVCKTEMEKDNKGRISAVLVVGKSRISTVLGKAKGIEIAQQRAVNDAKGKFMQWLKEDVSVRQGQDDETVVLLEGMEEDGKDGGKKESGKAIEKNTTKFESVAKGLLRGLQIVYYDQDGKELTYTVVMKWSTKSNQAAAQAEKELNRPPDEDLKKPGGPTGTPTKKPGEDKTIPSKKGVIDDD
jgi:hypothetical protein